MLQITTSRLRLLPLNPEQLQLLVENRVALERDLGLHTSVIELSADDSFWDEYESAMSEFVLPMVTLHPNDYPWFTHWIIIHSDLNRIIGGIGMGGLPNPDGEVMLGYYIDRHFEGQGLTTEAVQGLTGWAFLNDELTAMIADTPVGHIASQKVLQKNGFVFAGAVEEGLRWQLLRK